MNLRLVSTGLVLCLAAGLFACRSSTPESDARNLVLVSLDTLRADHLGLKLGDLPVTPELDRLSREGCVFTQALTSYASTTAAHMSLFTGLYASAHETLHARHTLSEEIPTLPEILTENGYRTAAFTENGMLDGGAGFRRGFSHYDERKPEGARAIEQTIGRATDWLRKNREEPFFLFVHSYQVHQPYVPPPEHRIFSPDTIPEPRPNVARTRSLYAGEVHYADSVLGQLFAELRRRDLADRTLVIVLSDHGEEFGEHGAVGHARSVYDEVIRVPLLLWAPGWIPAGHRVDAQISLVDLLPTLLEMLEIDSQVVFQGESLGRSVLDEQAVVSQDVRFVESPTTNAFSPRLLAARTPRYKWITRGNEPNSITIYDLEADPGEKQPLQNPELQERGRALFERYRAEARLHRKAPQAERTLDPATQKRLEALGYVD